MPATLPDGYTWRRATPDDAPAILGLVADCNTAVLGFADCTLDDIRNDLAEPGFVLKTDTWLVHGPTGALAAYAWVLHRGAGEQVDIDVITRDDRLPPWLYAKVLARAEQLAGPDVVAYQGIYRADTRARAAAQAHGLIAVTAFHRMRVDHGGPPSVPVAPPGVTLRTGPGDLDFRITAHALMIESFKDHLGFVAVPFEDWHTTLEQESTFDWSQLTVAYLDSHPVAVLILNDSFVETDDCGYVAELGVLPEARGRGIAKYLLRTAFAADAAAGRAGTLLHVDTNNTTPALGLYESVGMRPVLVIDKWGWSRRGDQGESTTVRAAGSR